MLRNRKTGEVFAVEHGRVAQLGFYKQTKLDNTNAHMSEFLAYIESNLSDLDTEKKAAVMTVMRALTVNSDFQRFCRQPAYLQKQIQAILAQHQVQQQAERATSLASFSQNTASMLAIAALNQAVASILPAGALALALLPLVVAQVGYSASEGIPPGGQDYCTGKLFGCLQGYITVNENGTDTVVAQFQRAITSVGETDNGAYLQLKDCIDIEALGELAFRVYGIIDGKKGITCSAQQAPWNNYAVSGILSNMSVDACIAYKNEFGVLANRCESTLGATLKTAQIAGGVIGGICLLACCVAAGYGVFKCVTEGEVPRPPCLN